MQQTLDLAGAGVDGRNYVACADLIGVVEIGVRSGFRATGAMNDVSYTGKRGFNALQVIDGPGTYLDLGQVTLDEVPAAGLAQEDGYREISGAERVEYMATHKAARACEQDLQSNNAEFLTDFAQFSESKIDLLVRMGGH